MYPAVEYLDWLHGRPATALYDLGASERRRDHADPAVVPPTLDGLADPPAGATLPALIATYHGVTPDRVLVTAGVDHAAALATAVAIGDSGDGHDDSKHGGGAPSTGSSTPRALVERPSQELRRATPRSFGAAVDRFERDPGGDPPFSLRPEQVREEVRPETSLVTVSNRHEASGQGTDEAALSDAVAVVRDAGAQLLVVETGSVPVDDVADTARETTAEAPGETAGQRPRDGRRTSAVTAAGIEGSVVAGSLSRFPGLGGLRVGWLIADPSFVGAARRYATALPSVAGPSATLARRALYHAESLDCDATERYRENAALVEELLDRRGDLSGFVSEGSPVALLAHEGADGDALAAAAWEAGVLVVPGRFFELPSHVRLFLGGASSDVAAGLRTFEATLDGLRDGM